MKTEAQYIAANIELKERNQKLEAELFLATPKLEECNRIIQELQQTLNIRTAKLFSPKTETETSMQIDEAGYFPIHRDDASLLFQLIARRYEKKSTAVTTNLKLSTWGRHVRGCDGGKRNPRPAPPPFERICHKGEILSDKGLRR